MPADYEMLVSHSPPVYSHSPPMNFLKDYNSFRFGRETISRVPRVTVKSPQRSLSFINNNTNSKVLNSPIRPCLVKSLKTDGYSTPNVEEPTSPTKLKKKVVFADDKGMSLTHVRIMTEPSNVPPVWSLRFLAQVTQGMNAEPEAKEEPWEITFAQPASDYVNFRQRLEKNKVSLENVIIKQTDETIIGTIKVSNLSYEKEVFVRVSSDNWKTYEDAFCSYVQNTANKIISAAYVLYDTFSFKLPLPPKSRRVEFCVCFRCNGNEYWDNNDGKNYVIIKKVQNHALHKSLSSDDLSIVAVLESKPIQQKKYSEAIHAKVESWSEFASWNHLENNCPYW